MTVHLTSSPTTVRTSSTTPVGPRGPSTAGGAAALVSERRPGPGSAARRRSGSTTVGAPLDDRLLGRWVAVACTDGEYRGRVTGLDGHQLRLRSGGGWWVLEQAQVLGVSVLEEPVRASVDPALERQRAHERVQRILSRWP